MSPSPGVSITETISATAAGSEGVAALFATVTRLDGAFGFMGNGVENPLQGGLAGLAKTAAVEWEGVCCRAIDIEPSWHDIHEIATAVVAELLYANVRDAVEVGLDAGSRSNLQLVSNPYAKRHHIETDLNPGDVVVVSGGARGVTAAAVKALAQYVEPKLVLLGRSPIPQSEPDWLKGILDVPAMKKAIIANDFHGRPASPKQVEKKFKERLANREILSNIEELKQAGIMLKYYSVDIRDSVDVNRILNEVRAEYGPIQAVIHGAGILEDRLIVDKTTEQFRKVFNTKVDGLESLLAATSRDPLKYLILFSSISARMGNKGQADYAMANEVLNKMAQQEAFRRHDCRVISFNWGPWDGGMVTEGIKREFARRRIEPIPLETGALCMLCEMAEKSNRPVEVVVGGPAIPARSQPSKTPAKPTRLKDRESLALTFSRELDVNHFPVLGAHVIGGKPVVPFALMAEWLGHGALHGNPGLKFCGIDDMRLLKGIKLDRVKKTIRLMAGKTVKNGNRFEVDLELRDGVKDGREVIHSRAKAVLGDRPMQPPAYELPRDLAVENYARPVADIYQSILFHGHDLHGIKRIMNCSPLGMTAKLASAPPPVNWMKEPLRSRWISDPLVLDCAFQMAIVWCHEQVDKLCLPSYCASYRQYRDSFPTDGVTAVLEVREVSEHKLCGDFIFLDSNHTVVARLRGYEAVMDVSLFKAFKPQPAAKAS